MTKQVESLVGENWNKKSSIPMPDWRKKLQGNTENRDNDYFFGKLDYDRQRSEQ
jgi:hypothetical protein